MKSQKNLTFGLEKTYNWTNVVAILGTSVFYEDLVHSRR